MVSQNTEGAKALTLRAQPEPVKGRVLLEPEPLSLDDYVAIKNALVEGHRTDRRNVLLVQMLFGTGLRIAEVLRLTPRQVERNGPDTVLYVQRGKRHPPRWEAVPIHPQLGMELQSYAAGNGILPGGPIFALTARRVQQLVKEAGYRALGRPVHPHMFRGLYTKTLIKELGVPLPAAAKMLGHRDVITTLNHYFALTQAERRAINQRLPL